MSAALDGRVALVTGAGQGVGRGIALALAAAGAAVIVAARRSETGEVVAGEIGQRGGIGLCVVTDATVAADVERAITITTQRFGGLDIVVHNAFSTSATATKPYRLEDADEAMWTPSSRTAVWGTLHCARAAHRHLVESGRGRFIVVTSPAGVEGSATLPLYAAVKGAQRAFAKSLAREWGPEAITVNCIAPVAVTPALESAFAGNPDLRARLEARTVLGRLGDPERDIGSVAVFLASDAGGYVTGQTIVCDGGGFIGL